MYEQKQADDLESLAHYEIRLKGRKKHYLQSAEAFTTGGRRNRAMAVGECVLQAMAELQKAAAQHHFVPGTLSWIIGEDRAVDPDGRKGYKYTVAYHIYADEQSLTDEEIEKELEETREKMEKETQEMFADVIEQIRTEEGMDPDPENQPCPPMPEPEDEVPWEEDEDEGAE